MTAEMILEMMIVIVEDIGIKFKKNKANYNFIFLIYLLKKCPYYFLGGSGSGIENYALKFSKDHPDDFRRFICNYPILMLVLKLL